MGALFTLNVVRVVLPTWVFWFGGCQPVTWKFAARIMYARQTSNHLAGANRQALLPIQTTCDGSGRFAPTHRHRAHLPIQMTYDGTGRFAPTHRHRAHLLSPRGFLVARKNQPVPWGSCVIGLGPGWLALTGLGRTEKGVPSLDTPFRPLVVVTHYKATLYELIFSFKDVLIKKCR